MSGEYREVLVDGLTRLNLGRLADGIRSKDLMLALTHSFVGNVKTREDLTQVFIKALEDFDFEGKQHYADKYIRGLKSGSMMPVESFGGRTNNGKTNGDKYYVSGELFFKT